MFRINQQYLFAIAIVLLSLKSPAKSSISILKIYVFSLPMPKECRKNYQWSIYRQFHVFCVKSHYIHVTSVDRHYHHHYYNIPEICSLFKISCLRHRLHFCQDLHWIQTLPLLYFIEIKYHLPDISVCLHQRKQNAHACKKPRYSVSFR